MASSLPNRPLLALSSNGKTLAFIPHVPGGDSGTSILRVLLFQVESGSLQATLTHRSKPGDTALVTPPLKIFFVGSDYLIALFSNQLLAWDLNRGVVAYNIQPKSDHFFHDACGGDDISNSGHLSLHVLVSNSEGGKVTIHDYNVDSGKMERKVKAGKGGAFGLGVTADYFVVRHEDAIRVLTRTDGQKVSKCSPLTEVNAGNQNLALCQSIGATISEGQIVLVDLKSGTKTASIPLDSKAQSSTIACFNLWQQDEGFLILSEGEKLHKISLSQGKVEKTWSCPSDGSLQRQLRVGSKNTAIALLTKGDQYQVAKSVLNETEDTVDLSWKSADLNRDTTEKTKRKEAPKSSVLGPAQVGGEALVSEGPASKRSKIQKELDEGKGDADGKDESPTIGERLKMLQQVFEEESKEDDEAETGMEGNDFIPKQATTESLGKVLQQALHSGEEKLLELALAVRDVEILAETCKELPDDLLPGLLNAITSRLAVKGGRTEQLCVWISVLLRTGRIKSIAHLQPLRNLIQERIEVFPDLLQLQGRLSMMTPLE